MAVMLKLSEWEFKTTIINLLAAITDRVDSMQEQMGNVSREMKVLKKKIQKRNFRDQYHCNRKEECLQWTRQS